MCSINICTTTRSHTPHSIICVYSTDLCWHLIFIYQKQTKKENKVNNPVSCTNIFSFRFRFDFVLFGLKSIIHCSKNHQIPSNKMFATIPNAILKYQTVTQQMSKTIFCQMKKKKVNQLSGERRVWLCCCCFYEQLHILDGFHCHRKFLTKTIHKMHIDLLKCEKNVECTLNCCISNGN